LLEANNKRIIASGELNPLLYLAEQTLFKQMGGITSIERLYLRGITEMHLKIGENIMRKSKMTVSLTNNLDQPLAVINVTDSEQLPYSGILSYLSTTEDKQIIANRETKSVILPSGTQTEPITLWLLIIVDPKFLNPYKYVVIQLPLRDGEIPPITVLEADAEEMSSAFEFIQFLQVNSLSTTTENFYKCLQAIQIASEDKVLDISALDQCIHTASGNNNLSFFAVVFYFSYIVTYPYQYIFSSLNASGKKWGESIQFHVYQGSTLNQQDSMIIAGKKLGIIKMEPNSDVPGSDLADLNDYNGGYKFTYLDYSQTVSLSYSNMQLSNNFSIGNNPLITVLFSYQFERFITKDISDNRLTVLLLGAITNLNVFSTFLEPAKFPINSDESPETFCYVDVIVGLILRIAVSTLTIGESIYTWFFVKKKKEIELKNISDQATQICTDPLLLAYRHKKYLVNLDNLDELSQFLQTLHRHVFSVQAQQFVLLLKGYLLQLPWLPGPSNVL